MKILGIDFSHLFRRNYEATAGNELSEAYRRTLQTIASIREGYDRVAILTDGGQSYRKYIDANYKANRERMPAPYYEQLQRTLDRVAHDACAIFTSPEIGMSSIGGPDSGFYVEADDLCASLAAWCIAHTHACDIYGNDKDLLQLIDDEHAIRILHPSKGILTADSCLSLIGLPPVRVVDWLALAGDASDNYKPFPGWIEGDKKKPGIGDKTAAELLRTHGTVMAVVDAATSDDPDVRIGGHMGDVLRRGSPDPRAAAVRGLNLASLRRDIIPIPSFDALLAEPVWRTIPAETEPAPTVVQPPVAHGAPSHTAPAHSGAPRAAAPEPAPVPPSPPLVEREPTHPPAYQASETIPSARALARVERAPSLGIDRFAMQPRSLQELLTMADTLYQSRLFGQYPNAEAIAAVILEANERGISAGLALRNAYIVRGKPGWYAGFLVALVQSSKVCKVFRIVESTTERAVVQYQRVDDAEPRLFEYSIDEARQAGLFEKKSADSGDNQWHKRPRTMLRWAALRESARAFFSDVVCGMQTVDEIAGGGEQDPYFEDE